MRPLLRKIKPSRGYSHVVYIVLNILLPVIVFALVRAGFLWVAVAVVLLSKWRMFSVRPRFWIANIKTNAIDIVVGLSVVGLLMIVPNDWYRLAVTAAWALWLIVLKPRTSVLMVSLQAYVGLAVGLIVFYAIFYQAPIAVLVAGTGLLCYAAAYHFFYSFDERYTSLLSSIWAFFGACLAWIAGHLLVFYWVISQPALIIITIACILGTMYYLDHFDRLSKLVRNQLVFVGVVTIGIVWGALVYFYLIHGSENSCLQSRTNNITFETKA